MSLKFYRNISEIIIDNTLVGKVVETFFNGFNLRIFHI